MKQYPKQSGFAILELLGFISLLTLMSATVPSTLMMATRIQSHFDTKLATMVEVLSINEASKVLEPLLLYAFIKQRQDYLRRNYPVIRMDVKAYGDKIKTILRVGHWQREDRW